MGQFGSGQSVRRVEDDRFITGQGRYTDDIDLPGQAFGVVLRSPHAHAELASIDCAEALASPGVLAIWTGEDVAAAGIGDLPCQAPVENADGSEMKQTPRPALARGRVRFVGDGVAFVVAESRRQALDAAELVAVDYRPLAAVTGLAAADDPGAPRVWPQAPGNRCFDWAMGDAAAVERALAGAEHITRLRLRHNRLVPNAIETRASIGAFDGDSGRLTLFTSSQGVHDLRGVLADDIFHFPRQRLRVVTPDVGGGFGMKGFPYPEQILVLWAARELGRPVKWTGARPEAFQSDNHGRDLITEVTLGLDIDARIVALKVTGLANLGAYLSPYAPFIPTRAIARVLGGVYQVPAIHIAIRGMFTNTVPIDAYRGAGRPEAAYITERIVDAAARETGLGQAEFRRRNFIPPGAMPYPHPLGFVFDSGHFERNMDDAMARVDWDGFEGRRRAARKRGRLRGIGMSCYIESTLGFPRESAGIRFKDDGRVIIEVGTQSNGQGHETAYAQLLHERLGVAFEDIEIAQGDTDIAPSGGGTGGSRSLHLQGGAIVRGAEEIERKGKLLAAHVLEAAAADIEFAGGQFTIAGTDRGIDIIALAARARDREALPDDLKALFAEGLDTVGEFEMEAPNFPNGCHVCEVEIDPETGALKIIRYLVVDDFGVVINPMVVEGQVQGGVAQGIGQAALETCVYDPDSGQLVTGSFMDYAMPRADDLPDIEFHYNVVPCLTNPLGVKGCGEAGTVGAMPAVVNAARDALAAAKAGEPGGVAEIDAPLTPERIWRALRQAG